ncbi:hypothetical protein [Paenibacillus xylanexedens]|uniref:hypothetical protein n=1 Tax=Paenibacillus xylanexedens TaxID=528191 RepID=UPI000F53851F|nr:hypothetical protein [Paenibacillus xylanexedens]RPK31735.1 hypothetical protein EDO6_02362 [Paenibacillus xylanexedens]
MEEKVGLNFYSNLKEILDFYDEELSSKKLIPTTKLDALYVWTALALIVSGTTLLFISLGNFKSLLSVLLSTLAIVLLLSALGLMQLIVNSRGKTVKLYFGDGEKQQYLTLENKRSSKNENNILFAYRTDRIASKLNEMGIYKVEHITAIAEHLESHSQNTKSIKWLPIGIFGLFLIPLWTEFVGKYLSGTSSVIFLILLGSVLATVVYLLNIAFRIILWPETDKQIEIATIMKILLTSRV